jgi:hypothetical protein
MADNFLDKFKHPRKSDDSSWNGPQGSSDMDKDRLRRENRNSWDVKDISKQVDKAWKENDGFAGKLPESE